MPVGTVGAEEFEIVGDSIVVVGHFEEYFDGDQERFDAFARGVFGEAVIKAAGEGVGKGWEVPAFGLLRASEFTVAPKAFSATRGTFRSAGAGPFVGADEGA